MVKADSLKCITSGELFEISDLERQLRARFGVPLPTESAQMRFRHLGAFWQHWGIHRITCQATGKKILSVFPDDCPYPVWEHSHWIANANPPQAEPDFGRPLFKQMEELFFQCAIPHNTGAGNENCDYTDDWWNSKNCYLCHSGVECEDLKYCYRTYKVRSSQFCVFTFDSELSVDLVNCKYCYNTTHSIGCQKVRDSAFLYDCRNCQDCLFCWNLRNKQFYFENKYVGPEKYQQILKEWNLSSRKQYEKAKSIFFEFIKTQALHRAVNIDLCESSSGDYLANCKNSVNCYFAHDCEDCVNCVRGGLGLRDAVDCVAFDSNIERLVSSAFVTDTCYDIRYCYQIARSRFLEYCAFCQQCEECFACAGLLGKKYHILNKPYSREDYLGLKAKLIQQMLANGEYGRFFPGTFAATPYEESWSGFHFPLCPTEQKKLSFRTRQSTDLRSADHKDEQIPDNSLEATTAISNSIFWDSVSSRPFKIQEDDLLFAQQQGVPLNDRFYIRRLQENFRLLPFSGALREVCCCSCKESTATSLPGEFMRILCEKCYLDTVV